MEGMSGQTSLRTREDISKATSMGKEGSHMLVELSIKVTSTITRSRDSALTPK